MCVCVGGRGGGRCVVSVVMVFGVHVCVCSECCVCVLCGEGVLCVVKVFCV